jgi:hypothetical protein
MPRKNTDPIRYDGEYQRGRCASYMRSGCASEGEQDGSSNTTWEATPDVGLNRTSAEMVTYLGRD